MLYTPITKKAIRYCFDSHAGQFDKSGIPYVNHPLHLAEQMETEDETVVALLHDVMEDCGKTPDDLRALGISEQAAEALELLTHPEEMPYLDYVRALKNNPLAAKVKLADLKHNSDLTRLDDVRERDIERLCKYREARAILGAPMTPREENAQMIDARIEAGLSLLRKHYAVNEQAVDQVLASPVIGGRPHHARRFDIEGVGNLLVMTVKEAEENQLSSFVITPYAKNLPLLSTDYVYSGDKRFFLIELYDLAVRQDSVYCHGIESFAALASSWDDMPDFPTRPCWYDDIRPVCIAKTPTREQDELALRRFLEALQLFIDIEQNAPALSGEDLKRKWQLNKDYADRLIDEGGVSTDLFTEALGAENTRRFFDEVFFAPACYRSSARID